MSGLLVMLGGAIGAAMRYGIGLWVMKRWRGAFPVGTFCINGSGSFLLGMVWGGGDAEWVQLLLGTGVLGAFTTFSTFGVEAVTLWQRERQGLAIGYVLGTAALSIGAAWAGGAVV